MVVAGKYLYYVIYICNGTEQCLGAIGHRPQATAEKARAKAEKQIALSPCGMDTRPAAEPGTPRSTVGSKIRSLKINKNRQSRKVYCLEISRHGRPSGRHECLMSLTFEVEGRLGRQNRQKFVPPRSGAQTFFDQFPRVPLRFNPGLSRYRPVPGLVYRSPSIGT